MADSDTGPILRVAREGTASKDTRRVVYDPVAAKDEGCLRLTFTGLDRGLEVRALARHLQGLVGGLSAVEREISGAKRATGRYLLCEAELCGDKFSYVVWDGVIRHPELAVDADTPGAAPVPLKEQIAKLKSELAAARRECQELRERQAQ